MKSLILTLAITLNTAFAREHLYPVIFNYGNMAQVQVQNTTPEKLRCSGYVYLYTLMGSVETGYFDRTIESGRMASKNFYLLNLNDRINFTMHSIFCSQVL